MQHRPDYEYEPKNELMKNLPPASKHFSYPLRKLATAIATVAVLGLALMFSAMLIAVILLAGTIAWGYFWWKTRELRKQMRNYPPQGVVMDEAKVEVERDVIRGEIIEGEVIVVDEGRDEK